MTLPENYFGAEVARRYDADEAEMFDSDVVQPTVALLAELAGSGPALELGIGTGRIALPLANRGVPVHGIDLSEEMLARLRAKPGGDGIPVTLGDFSTVKLAARFSLVYLVFNTIQNLTTAEEQIACFQNAAEHLEPGGRFVIEVGMPQLRRLPPGERVRAFQLTPTRIGFDEYDVATQRLVSHHYSIVDGQLRAVSIPFRYVWPSELDLMARLSGMSLRERWGGWRREPFTSDTASHVSVWEK